MEMRRFGKTGLKVGVLGFGCGAVGGLMTKGDARDQERALVHTLELGTNYIDTAPSYGDGASETNLGRALAKLKPDVVVGTKVRIAPGDKSRIGAAIAQAIADSLRRLGQEHVDLYQLHNPITSAGEGASLTPAQVLNEVVPAFQKLKREGKISHIDITAIGEAKALHQVVDAKVLDTAQVAYNLLCPSAGGPLPKGFPAEDYGSLFEHIQKADMGVIGIRALAGGAFSGTETRHPLNTPTVDPIGSGASYATDVARGRQFQVLVQAGHAGSVIEAAQRYVISHPAVSTMLVGYATFAQLEAAAMAVGKGVLPAAALKQVADVQKAIAAAA